MRGKRRDGKNMLGAFVLLLGSPGKSPGQESGLSRLGVVQECIRLLLGGGGFGWLMFGEVLGALMALIFLALKRVGGVQRSPYVRFNGVGGVDG